VYATLKVDHTIHNVKNILLQTKAIHIVKLHYTIAVVENIWGHVIAKHKNIFVCALNHHKQCIGRYVFQQHTIVVVIKYLMKDVILV